MSTKTIQVPADQEHLVLQFLQSLSVQQVDEQAHAPEPEQDGEYVTVLQNIKSIQSHRITQQGVIYLVEWEDGETNWVNENEITSNFYIKEYREKAQLNYTFCFCRVSSKSQTGEDHVSLETQQNILAKNVKLFNVTKVIHSCGSAYKKVPADLLNIVDDCVKGDTISVYRVDRFGRNLVESLKLLEELNMKGVEVVSITENISYSTHKLPFIQYLINADTESFNISQRVKESIKYRVERGDEAIGSLPFGKKYKKVDDKLQVVVNEEEQQIISFIKESKDGNQKIADELNTQNKRKRKREWNKDMVRYAKKNY